MPPHKNECFVIDEEMPKDGLNKELDLQFGDSVVIKRTSYEDALDIIGK